jgi:DNA-binding GntR family transcriptional regulator
MIVWNEHAKTQTPMMRSGRTELLSQRICDEIETRIVHRIYPPGSHLAEDEIAAQLGASRTPVREAFRMLARAGWLDIQPHTGAFVRNPTMEEVRQVFEVRQTLEERAARLAAVNITGREIRELQKIIERGWREASRGNARQLSALNEAFHGKIARASRNQILARLLEDLARQVQWHFSAVASVRAESSWREHEGILAAVESRGRPARRSAGGRALPANAGGLLPAFPSQ